MFPDMIIIIHLGNVRITPDFMSISLQCEKCGSQGYQLDRRIFPEIRVGTFVARCIKLHAHVP